MKARKYPTVTLKGMVFIWMGDGTPAPLEEDIPPEFFDDITMSIFHTEYWASNWNVALEKGVDAHVPYVQRNSVKQLINPMPGGGPRGPRNKIIEGRAVLPDRSGVAWGPYHWFWRVAPALLSCSGRQVAYALLATAVVMAVCPST